MKIKGFTLEAVELFNIILDMKVFELEMFIIEKFGNRQFTKKDIIESTRGQEWNCIVAEMFNELIHHKLIFYTSNKDYFKINLNMIIE